MLDNKSVYSVRLANGQGWQITATEGTMSWVEKLASIMELKTCNQNGYPKLIFIRMDTSKESRGEPICYVAPNIQETLPRSGWKVHDLRLLRLWSHDDVTDVICEIGHKESDELDILSMLLALYPIFKRALDSGGLPFHAALAERDGIGILLAASGNTGKSTCCCRLQSPWQSLCDDKTVIVRDYQKQYLAHPFPTWSDHLTKRSKRTWNVQNHIPLWAIFFLKQAETDKLIPIGQGEAAALMNQSAMQVCHQYWNKLDRDEIRTLKKKLFDNACELAKSIPAYKLQVSMSGRFWEKIEAVLP